MTAGPRGGPPHPRRRPALTVPDAWPLALAGAAVALLSVVGSALVASTTAWADLSTTVMAHVRPRPGVWRLLRGGLHYLAIPGLLTAAVAILLALWRRDRHRALVFAGCLVATNVLVQVFKHGSIPGLEALNPLSGHAGVAAGLALSWYAVRGTEPGSARAVWPALAAGGLVAGTGTAVLLTGWHSLPEVLTPIGVGTGCALVGQTALAPATRPHASLPRSAMAAVAGLLAALVAAVISVMVWPRVVALPLVALMVCVTLVLMAAGMGVLTLRIGAALTGSSSHARRGGN